MTPPDEEQPPFRIEPLSKQHDRSGFSCGEPTLDQYFQTQVTQDIKRRYANCFVAVEVATDQVVGYYTLASASLALDELPEETKKRLPRYPSVPAVRIGRLAVATAFQKRGLGPALLADAAERAMDSAVAAHALTVDSISDKATAFYEKHGFIRLPSKPDTLFLPLTTLKKARLG